MSTDKTLADVQPGGRVRLGDQALRVFSAGRWTYDGTGQSFSHEEMDAAAFVVYRDAALSAQPSPGGQGDALLDQARKLFDELGAIADDDKCVAILAAALAARQPVGEPVGYLYDWTHSSALGRDEEIFTAFTTDIEVARGSKGGVNIRPVYAGPAQADQEYLESLDRALEGVIDQRDRYHEIADDLAGHIAAITGVDIGEHSSANCPWQNAIEAAEVYQPAQAVDLERFRPAVMTALGLSSPYGLERETLNELLDLIDSQAVGNG